MIRRGLTALLAVVILLAGAGVWWWHSHDLSKLRLPLGAGEPLHQSSSKISVLEEPLSVSDSTPNLPSQAKISLSPTGSSQPAVFDATAAKLGATLSMLINAWPQGGVLPHQLANAASALAERTNQPALAEAALSLRSSTPREGPLTVNLLLVEASHVLALPAPADLPVDDTEAEASKGWFRKQLEKLVSIRSTPATQHRWALALGTVQEQIARGAVADAVQTLESSPLQSDSRLHHLRELARAYLGQTGKLSNLITTYTNTYLSVEEEN